MRIAYIISSDIARYRGSTIKVDNQTREWKNQGMTVEIFSLTPDNFPALIETQRFIKRKSPFADKFLPYKGLIKAVESFNPDILYIRYSLPNVSFKILQKRYTSVIEINTDDKKEYLVLFLDRKRVKNLMLLVLDSILRGPFIRRAAGLITVTEELSRRKSFIKYNNNIKAIPNSIPLKHVTLKSIDSKNELIKLFFIGSPGLIWHGVDKLIRFAEAYPKEIEVHIVGMEGNNKVNIFWYGYLQEAEYLKIMSACHICVGGLALHRYGLNEASTLKVREYLSYGFPVILGYKDTAFLKEKPPWILEIPNIESSFKNSEDLEKILLFCKKYKNYIIQEEDVAPFIDSRKIEKKRLDFMNKIWME